MNKCLESEVELLTTDVVLFSEDSMIKKSQASLESSTKSSEEEGSDSLGVYEDVDPTKFNDEGSFVDQMGYKKTNGTKPSADVTSPSALSTFV